MPLILSRSRAETDPSTDGVTESCFLDSTCELDRGMKERLVEMYIERSSVVPVGVCGALEEGKIRALECMGG